MSLSFIEVRMNKKDIQCFFGSLTKLALLCDVKPQAVSQWFDRDGVFIGDEVRRNAIIGSARLINKSIPNSWLEVNK